jgi:hypothetical protein
MGVEKNAAGHRLRINKDFVGYFDSARQQGRACTCCCCCVYSSSKWCSWCYWPLLNSALQALSACGCCKVLHCVIPVCSVHSIRLPGCAAEVEEKEVIAPWKVPEPDALRHKGPVVQVGPGCFRQR